MNEQNTKMVETKKTNIAEFKELDTYKLELNMTVA